MIVSDIRGVLPLFQDVVAVLEDARQRFLVPGGIMIPQRDILMAALVEAPECYSDLTSPWEKQFAGLDLSSPLPPILNQLHKANFAGEQLLTLSLDWGVLDYTVGAPDPRRRRIGLRGDQSGTVHGLSTWSRESLNDFLASVAAVPNFSSNVPVDASRMAAVFR